LFATHPNPPARPPQARPAALRQATVRVDFEQLIDALPPQAGGRGLREQLNLNLFPDASFTALRSRVEITGTGYVWLGTIANFPTGSVTLAVTDGVMSGSVVVPQGSFTIRYAGADAHSIEQVNLADMPPELEPLLPPAQLQSAALADAPAGAGVDDGSLIDLLVVWTPAARIAAGGTAAIQSLVDLGITETNQAYASTGAIQRIRLRRKEEINYAEAPSMGTDLSRLQSASDGFLDSVHSLRNTYAADLTQLIVNTPQASCGIAYLMSTVAASFASFAFGVTDYGCISPNYTFAHEMGHNMGLRHDTHVDAATTPFTYAHGYVNQAAFAGGAGAEKRWRTIMAYNDQCAASGFNCTRLLYFSNPNNLNTGDPMGHVTTAHAGLTLDNTRATTANFRTEILAPLDNFADARFIFTSSFADSLATAAFTSEGTDPAPACGGGVNAKSAWYRFTPRESGMATIGTAGSAYDTIVSVYTGSTGSFVSQGCNDDANATVQSQLSIPVTAGVAYSVMISAKAGDGGTLQLAITAPIERSSRPQLVSQ
jgi:hypothetical protein